LDVHDTTAPQVITILKNQIDALESRRQRIDLKIIALKEKKNGVVEISSPPNSSTLPVTSDNINNGEGVTADEQRMSLLTTTTQNANATKDDGLAEEHVHPSLLTLTTGETETLYRVIDRLFAEADKNTVTTKDIVQSVANDLTPPQQVDKDMKKKIKARLMYLMEQSEVVNGSDQNSYPLTEGEGIAEDKTQPSISTRNTGDANDVSAILKSIFSIYPLNILI
jgi:hypothetical protein